MCHRYNDKIRSGKGDGRVAKPSGSGRIDKNHQNVMYSQY